MEMLSAFFATKLGRTLLIGGSLAVAGGLAYWSGSNHGYASGNSAGFKAGYASRNTEVADLESKVTVLTTTINDERKAVAKKIDEVQAAATADALKTQKELSQQIRNRDAIITNYKSTVPLEKQNECAVSLETVKAINALINSANKETP